MDVDLVKKSPGDNSENNKKRRMNKKAKTTASKEDETQIQDQMDDTSEASDKLRDFKEVNKESEETLINKELTVQPLDQNPKMDAGAKGNPSEGKKDKEKMKNQNRIEKKAKVVNEIQSMDLMEMNAGTTENLAECNTNAGTTGNIAACNVNGKRKKMDKWCSKKTAKNKDIIGNMDQGNVAMPSSDENHEPAFDKLPENEFSAQKSELSVEKEYGICHSDYDINEPSASLLNVRHYKESPLDLCKHEESVSSLNVIEVLSDKASSESVQERSEPPTRPMELEGKSIPCESHHKPHPNQTAKENEKLVNGLDEVNSETKVYQGKCAAEVSTCNVEVTIHLSSSDVKDEEDLGQYPTTAVVSCRRKLLVLDVNGLLANIIMPAPKDCRADTHLLGRAIFKRPFCDDFLKFCFQNFDVGIWSSRSKRIIDKVVDYLLGNLRDKLLFCWDMEHSTQTGFKTLENSHKPLVFKELRKIWENNDPTLPWKKGDYDESNTLLLDDSPYKALVNPLHTAIFPRSYHYEDKNDNSLGPGGDLRVYLEGLLTSVNVRNYVEQHPFGQSAINETNMSWAFYSGVLQTMSNRLQDNTPHSLPNLS